MNASGNDIANTSIAAITTQSSTSSAPKIAFITAIYGKYEKTCKAFHKQTLLCDFICFTDDAEIASNGWTIDTEPYHDTHASPLDNDDAHVNSLRNNRHTFNIAKYYKQNFQNIPRLQQYDIVVWLDGTVEITSPDVCTYLVRALLHENNVVCSVEHTERKGRLAMEVTISNFDRYNSTFWFGQHQPVQNLRKQYREYVKKGYNDLGFWRRVYPHRPDAGVWVTCFVAWNMRHEQTKQFLDMWYLQTLSYSTQDQVGFPFVCQMLKIYPKTFPEHVIGNDAKNTFYTKHVHHK